MMGFLRKSIIIATGSFAVAVCVAGCGSSAPPPSAKRVATDLVIAFIEHANNAATMTAMLQAMSRATCKHDSGDKFVCRYTPAIIAGTFVYRVTDDGVYRTAKDGERFPMITWKYLRRGQVPKAPTSPVPAYAAPKGPSLPFFKDPTHLPSWMGGGRVPSPYWGVCGTPRIEEVTNDGCGAIDLLPTFLRLWKRTGRPPRRVADANGNHYRCALANRDKPNVWRCDNHNAGIWVEFQATQQQLS